MAPNTELDWKWLSIGILLVGGVAYWTLLSGSFVYGESHEQRPIIEFLVSYGIVWAAFASAVFLVSRGRSAPLWWILTVAFLARAILLPSNLIQENDVYRYVLDGKVLLHGENPFEYAPLVLPGYATGELAADLETPEAQTVLDRVGYPWIPTIYPPVAQLAFAAGSFLGGWSWLGQRAVFTLVDAVLILLLLLLLKRQGRPPAWVVLYAWNPLPLKEIVNSAHFDILVALFVLLLAFSLHRFGAGIVLSAPAAGVFLALAVLTKLYPVILLPACLTVFRHVSRAGFWFVASFGATCLLCLLAFTGVGWERLIAGLSAYAESWRMNEGVFSLVDLASDEPRLVTALVLGSRAVLLPLSIERHAERPESAFFWILLLWFLLIPTPYPWYAVPVLALGVVYARSAPVVTVMSGVLSLYYLSFYFEYRESPGAYWGATKAIEHALIWFVLLWTCRPSAPRDSGE